jgi:LacI family transcriptional regulator
MWDVARLAKVSQSTVSLALNNDPRVAALTREKVLRAADDLGFHINRAARELSSKRSKVIGFVTDRMATSPWAGRTILGAQEAAWANDYILMVVDAGESQELRTRALKLMLEQQVDSIIFAAMIAGPVAIEEPMTLVPSVLVNCFAAGDPAFPKIVADEVEGGYIATRELIDNGHRDIVFLNGPADNYTAGQREQGHRKAMREAFGKGVKPPVLYGDYEIVSGYHLMRQYATGNRGNFTGVVCGNDRMALGALQALTEIGLAVPRDVSIVGYDDQPFLASNLHPALTTVVLPLYEMGKTAIKLLLPSGEGRAVPSQTVRSELVRRDSVRRL